jgi:thiosulfate/3-mercaptopyruvate sulfurtransferase
LSELDFEEWPLVESEWLAEHLSDPRVRIVDTRRRGDGSGAEHYKRGHIQGAVHLDWHDDLNHSVRNVNDLLIPPDKFAEVMTRNGISNDSLVVAYADQDYSGAARLWWALRLYGHEQTAVLNGGYDKWNAENRKISQELPVPNQAIFVPEPQPDWLATVFEISQSIIEQDSNVCLVDTRPPEQYRGEAFLTPTSSRYLTEDQDWIFISNQKMRSGHIPGAKHLDSSGNLDPTNYWTFLSPEDLCRRAISEGIGAEQRVITYSWWGISASMGLFSFYLAGYRNLSLYDGSSSEWGTDLNRPVERD